jgi:hypothetical protein
MPEEQDALRAALALERSLRNGAQAPLERFLPAFLRLSARIASRLEEQLAGCGHTEVRLRWEGPEELTLVDGTVPPADALPLADWRALVSSDWAPDEVLLPRSGDPGHPDVLAQAARAAGPGVYPVLRHARLLVLATESQASGHGRMRAVQCPVTDPVSWALVEGREVALFPDVAGWSARDWAARAVAEHRAWLQGPPSGRQSLIPPLKAARVAAFAESVEAGQPELLLTLAGAARWLDRRPGVEGAPGQAALAAYVRMCRDAPWRPPADVVRAVNDAVRSLPAFSGASRTRSQAA